jgi:hypothetical protein
VQVLNVAQAPYAYPLQHGGDPNGALFPFVRMNLYVNTGPIWFRWQRAYDDNWTDEILLQIGYYSFDRDGQGIEVRSQLVTFGTFAFVIAELVEPQDISGY